MFRDEAKQVMTGAVGQQTVPKYFLLIMGDRSLCLNRLWHSPQQDVNLIQVGVNLN